MKTHKSFIIILFCYFSVVYIIEILFYVHNMNVFNVSFTKKKGTPVRPGHWGGEKQGVLLKFDFHCANGHQINILFVLISLVPQWLKQIFMHYYFLYVRI